MNDKKEEKKFLGVILALYGPNILLCESLYIALNFFYWYGKSFFHLSKVWEIPEGGLAKNLSEPVADLCAHQRRVGVINWHPSAYLVLLSAGSDNKLFVWNVATAEILTEIGMHPDTIYSAVWNYSGSQILTTCKDKMIRVFNPRTGAVLKENKGHQVSKTKHA